MLIWLHANIRNKIFRDKGKYYRFFGFWPAKTLIGNGRNLDRDLVKPDRDLINMYAVNRDAGNRNTMNRNTMN